MLSSTPLMHGCVSHTLLFVNNHGPNILKKRVPKISQIVCQSEYCDESLHCPTVTPDISHLSSHVSTLYMLMAQGSLY